MDGHPSPISCTEVTAQCPVQASIYGYYPNRPTNAALTVAFGILMLIQGWQTFKYKTYSYSFAMTVGCLGEAIGYVGRIILHDNPFSATGFQMQITTLIMAPAFFSAAIYLILKHLCLALGPNLSLIKPRFYTWIFIGVDILSLTLQGIGGGLAATARTNKAQQDAGTNVMIAGIVWQVFTLTVFGILVGHFFWRVRSEKRHSANPVAKQLWGSRKFKLFLGSTTIAFFFIFIRCVYRIAEMVGGWRNEIMQDEVSFIVLESFLCLIAAILLTAFHAGDCFPQMRGDFVATKYVDSLPLSTDTSYVAVHKQPLINRDDA
ncbi:sphingoid long-chain base transporter RSB1 [Arthroderma uncinatum]|uniref:sphingoid long-chain base transporter RSB1 n=1 Tax=Arthroderma uncinatum TaxID=74035 RepID=UPI00144A8875|nr:sphingoid long-chain base transporter RSB1 [Arthroderma uncinatum]KAF3480016.1 sphingoid long-chain base transporter RSB1 [Arthroderma uncinatum]